jgi:hypothetical protein
VTTPTSVATGTISIEGPNSIVQGNSGPVVVKRPQTIKTAIDAMTPTTAPTAAPITAAIAVRTAEPNPTAATVRVPNRRFGAYSGVGLRCPERNAEQVAEASELPLDTA